MSDLLQVTDYSLSDGGAFSVAIPQLRLDAGATVALYGPSGCGKTSMLVSIFGLLERPNWRGDGRVTLGGRALEDLAESDLQELRRRDMAFLMQDAHNALDPLVRVGDQIQTATDASPARVVEMLERLGIEDAAGVCERQPHRISGGQAQRVLLAIAFLRKPALVIADEPSASLDGGSYQELLGRLRELVANGSALLMATHDHRLLRDLNAEVYALTGDVFVKADKAQSGAVGRSTPLPVQQAWPNRPAEDVGSVAVLKAEGLGVSYGSRAVLDHVDFELRRGEITALLGESGAGKTTLLRVLAGHHKPDAGTVVRPERRSAIQLVCQDAFGSLTPKRRLQSMLEEASAPFFDAEAGASSVHLPTAVLDRKALAMSGGERRRAALLRALAVQPDVLLLDEPTASLDREAAVAVIKNLLTMQRSRALALLIATHDEDLAEAIAHRRLTIRAGQLCELD